MREEETGSSFAILGHQWKKNVQGRNEQGRWSSRSRGEDQVAGQHVKKSKEKGKQEVDDIEKEQGGKQKGDKVTEEHEQRFGEERT